MNNFTCWKKIRLGPTGKIDDTLPAWAEFFLELGVKTYHAARLPGKTFLIVLLPTRIGAAAVAALGVLAASAEENIRPLTKKELLDLPIGSQVVSFETVKNKKAVWKWRIREGKGDRLRELFFYDTKCGTAHSFHISENTSKLRDFYDETAASQGKVSRLKKEASFYRTLIDRPDSKWPYLLRTECLIITNRAKWEREIQDLEAAVFQSPKSFSDNNISLSRLLMFDEISKDFYQRVSLSSYGDKARETSLLTPVILDGPEALLSHDSLQSRSILCLLSRTEYSSEVKQTIQELLNCRSDELTAQVVELEATGPAGTDMIVFSLEEKTL